MIQEGFTCGINSNESGRFNFDMKEVSKNSQNMGVTYDCSAIEDPSLIYQYCQTEVPKEIQAKRDSLKRRKEEKLRATGMLDEVLKIDPQMQLFEMAGSF